MTDRELLRFHIEAVWNLTLPPLDEAAYELILTQSRPPWSLYLGSFAQEQVAIWHAAVAPEQQLPLLEQARRADAVWDQALKMRREIVFHAPRISPTQQAQSQQFARILTAEDVDLLNAMRPEEAPITLKPQKTPYIGVVIDGQLVSIAHSSRKTSSACELGIDTIGAARRRGYAAAATVLWTALVQQQGLVPIYSAYAENTASLHLAQTTGYLPGIAGVYGPVPEDSE